MGLHALPQIAAAFRKWVLPLRDKKQAGRNFPSGLLPFCGSGPAIKICISLSKNSDMGIYM